MKMNVIFAVSSYSINVDIGEGIKVDFMLYYIINNDLTELETVMLSTIVQLGKS